MARSSGDADTTADRRAAPGVRVALGGISHETNTFNGTPTGLDAFRRRAYLVGDAVPRAGRGAPNALGGMIDAADERGVALVPTAFAAAMPGGVVSADAFGHLRALLLGRLREANERGLDGVLLALHGAMVAEGADDAEGALLDDVRAVVGPDVPIVAVLDFHANVSPAMVAAADLLLGYATYPHIDTYQKGEEALRRLLDIRAGRLRPTVAFRALPLLTPLPPQCTTAETPMRAVMALATGIAARPGVVAVTVSGGFPYADVAAAGMAVQVATDDDRALAETLADSLADALWTRRDDFVPGTLVPDAALDRAADAPPGRPVVLADTGDNPGAGADGDGTALLAALLDRNAGAAALAAIHDPDAVVAAFHAGEGARLRVRLGGKGDPRGGEPLPVTALVRHLSDGVFTNRGPLGTGGVTRLGRTAVLQIGDVAVIVCANRAQILEPACFCAVGIDPRRQRILAVKSSVHYRAAFGPMAEELIAVGTPGLSASDLASFPYARVRRPIAPLDATAGGRMAPR